MVYLFNNNLQLLATTELAMVSHIVDEIPILYSYYGVFPDTLYPTLINASYLGVVDDLGKFQMFKLKTVELDDDVINVDGISKFLDDMEAIAIIPDRRFTTSVAEPILSAILSYTPWTLGTVGVVAPVDLMNFYYISPLEAIKKVLSVWDLEIETETTLLNGQITAQIASFKVRGDETDKRYEYGVNALRIAYRVDKGDVFTALIGRGKGEEVLDEAGNPTGGYGRRVGFEDIVWTVADPVVKPLGQGYVELPTATAKYGYAGGTIPRMGVVIFEQITDPAEVLAATYLALLDASRELVAYDGDVYTLNKHKTGDRVVLVRPDIKLAYKSRVIKRDIDLLDVGSTKLTMGDQRVSKTVADNRAINTKIDEVLTETIVNRGFYEQLALAQTDTFFAGSSFSYSLDAGNVYGLPAGFYSFEKPIDQNPTQLLVLRAGTIGISYRPTGTGAWTITTFGNGKGFNASQIVTGILLGGKVKFNLDLGTLTIGDAGAYTLNWDGTNLYIKGDTIDLSANTALAVRLAAATTSANTYTNGVAAALGSVEKINYLDGTQALTVLVPTASNTNYAAFRVSKKLSGKVVSFRLKISSKIGTTGSMTVGVHNGTVYVPEPPFNYTPNADGWIIVEGLELPTFTTENVEIRVFAGLRNYTASKGFSYEQAMLNEGSKSLGWIMSPADMLGLANTVGGAGEDSILKRLNSVETITTPLGISTIIKETTDITSYIDGRANTVVVSKGYTTMNDVNGAVSTVSTQISDVNGRVTEIKNYFKFSAEGLRLGLEGSIYSVRIDNDSLDIMQGDQIAAEFSNLRTKTKAIVAESAEIGYIKYEKSLTADSRICERELFIGV